MLAIAYLKLEGVAENSRNQILSVLFNIVTV